MKHVLLSFLFVAATGMAALAQEQPLKIPSLSPTEKMSQEFSTSSIDITYSRPSMRGRVIFGDIIPYGKAWRTGANAPTKIKFGEDITIGGQDVKAGDYALYTIPGKDEWEIIINKGTGNWGPDGFNAGDDVARFKIKPTQVDKFFQTFTIDIASITFNSCKLEMMWEKTKLIIPIETHNEPRVSTAIDKAISNPSIPYAQAANYYFESGQNLEKANTYVDKALADNPTNFNMWFLKARIEKKLGHKQEAIAAAHKSIETSKGSPFERDYVHNNQKILDELK